jgi:drug/metabolite transporter (DMT)-like permease
MAITYCCAWFGSRQCTDSICDELGTKMVDPTRAAIIYAGEPVWAGVFGRIAGERLPLLALLGGCLVVLGVLVSELKLKILNHSKE